MKRLRHRHLAAIVASAALLVFLLCIWVTEMYTSNVVQHRSEQYADFLSTPLWQMDEKTCFDYLTLITEIEPYSEFRVLHADGSEFVHVKQQSEHSFLETPLRKLGLIRNRPMSAPIYYAAEPIGRIDSLWNNRNIYLYLALAPLLATIAFGLMFSRYLRHLRDKEQANKLHLEQEKVKALESKRALEKTEARYKTLIEKATDIIYECDTKGRFTYLNPTASSQLGYKTEDLLGAHFARLVKPELRRELVEHYRDQLVRERENSYREFEIVTGDGKEIWIGQNVQLVRSDGEVVGFQAVARDITDLKNAMSMLAERDEHLIQEMQLARQIHRSLMPISVPKLRGFDFGLRFAPSGMIGGDFINFVKFPDGNRLGVVFADITGHGVAAALLSAMLKVLVDEVMHTGASPASCFAMLNKRVSQEFPEGNYVSAFYAIFDRTKRTMTYVKASQEPAYVMRATGEVECLEEGGGPALGLFDPFCFGDPTFEQETLHLHPGDTVFFYTDGLIELWNDDQEILEREALLDWLNEEKGNSPQDLVDGLYHRAVEFAGTTDLPDDVAELAVRVTEE